MCGPLRYPDRGERLDGPGGGTGMVGGLLYGAKTGGPDGDREGLAAMGVGRKVPGTQPGPETGSVSPPPRRAVITPHVGRGTGPGAEPGRGTRRYIPEPLSGVFAGWKADPPMSRRKGGYSSVISAA